MPKANRISWLKEAQLRYDYNEDLRKKGSSYIPKIVGKVKSILDFGCSVGYLLDLFPDVKEKFGIEIDDVAREICKARVYKVFRSISDAPKVDLITAVDVIEHLDASELLVLLPQFYKHLNDGGRLFIQTCNPYCLFSMIDFWNDYSHKRMYGISSISSLLKLSGFKIIQFGYVHEVGARPLYRFLMHLLERFSHKRYFNCNYFVLARKRSSCPPKSA